MAAVEERVKEDMKEEMRENVPHVPVDCMKAESDQIRNFHSSSTIRKKPV